MKKLILICLILFTACAGFPSASKTPPRSEKPKHLPEPSSPLNKNKALGRQFIQAALKDYIFVKDYEVLAQVNRVGRSILSGIGEDPEDFHFFVIRQNQLNAFAVPGGYIFFFDGLLKELKTVDALAGVLAHEVAHVQNNHFFKDADKMNAINLATMASIILAGLTGENIGATGVIGSALNISAQLKFSRANEEEADIHAIEYLKQSPYDPLGLADFFKTLSFYAGFTRGAAPPYFSTHPGLSERKFMVETLMKDFQKQQRPLPSSTEDWRHDWARSIAILNAENMGKPLPLSESGTKEAETQTSRQLYLAGLSQFRAGELQKAAKNYQEAIRLEPDQAIYYADLSYIWMQLQKAKLAKSTAYESIRLSKNSPTPYLVLGMIAQSEEDHQTAVNHLRDAKNRAPDYGFVHLQLARSYHALSMPGLEKFHLGQYHRLNFEPIKSLTLYQQALTLLQEGSPLALSAQREIEEITRDGI